MRHDQCAVVEVMRQQPVEVFSLDLQQRRLLVRVDMNVPLQQRGPAGPPEIRDDTRITACVPGISRMLSEGAAVTLISHLGRPVAGHWDAELSLAPVAQRLAEQLQVEVPLCADWLESAAPAPGCITMGENLRFLPGETEDDEALAMRMAAVCDVYVNDAFAVSHRAHASVCGVVRHAPMACAGPVLSDELRQLSRLLEAPTPPVVVVVGGAKVDSKLPVLQRLQGLADHIIVGGGVANALLHAAGYDTGASPLPEASLAESVQEWLQQAPPGQIVLPVDLVCATRIAADADTRVCAPDEVSAAESILDLGPATAQQLRSLLASAGTIVWSGPMGVFECAPFAAGTRAVAEATAAAAACSVVGGGDTLAALAAFGGAKDISFCSTGGGAFLAFLAGEAMPPLEALNRHPAP